MRQVEDGIHLPRPGLCVAVTPDIGAAEMPEGLDDRTLDYIERARAVFDGIARISGQLAGLLILAAAGARSAQGHPMFALIEEARDEVVSALAALRPTEAARHHHRHLMRAARALSKAVEAAARDLHRWDGPMMEDVTQALRHANQQLQWATRALPGFAVVDLRQSCCAMHIKI